MRNIRLILFVVFLISVSSFLIGCSQKVNYVSLSKKETNSALKIAKKYKGLKYKLGGRKPPKFDCSGLITFSYKKTLGKEKIFYDGNKIVDDATIDNLYNYNTQKIAPSKVEPGDIIFITKSKDKITHGGFFVEWVEKYDKFRFLNASSYHGKVVISEWEIGKQKRKQWFEGFGRLKISH